MSSHQPLEICQQYLPTHNAKFITNIIYRYLHRECDRNSDRGLLETLFEGKMRILFKLLLCTQQLCNTIDYIHTTVLQ
jgi:hypothetical protein